MKVLFYGTPSFAVPTLQRLLDSSHEVVGVVTQPDKPAGRGNRVTAPPVKQLAEKHQLKVLQPASVKKPEFAEEIRALAPDVAVVVAYGKILPRAALDAPRHGSLNIHASLLPKYRGAAPIQWAIIGGETETGVTIMQMDEGLDSGPIIDVAKIDILDDDDATSVAGMLSVLGGEKMLEVLDRLESEGSLPMEPQDHETATRAPLIERRMAQIDWDKPAAEIILKVRGFLPWPKAFTTLDAKELKIVGAEGCLPDWVNDAAKIDEIIPGTVVEHLKGRGFVVRGATAKDLVLVTRVQPPGKPMMGAIDYVNGGSIEVGSVLGK